MNSIDNSHIRRRDRILDDETIMNIITTGEFGTLSMVEEIHSENSEETEYKGYGIPLNYVYDSDKNCLYFHGAYEGKKMTLLKQHPKVTFSIVGKTNVVGEKLTTEYQSVLLQGEMILEIEGDEKTEALYKYVEKYVPGYSRQQLEERFGAMINGSYKRTQISKLVNITISGKGKKVFAINFVELK